ncbi:hypothetical protein SELMODRAFT_425250 [Selaginella moellendorffii]|uniref:Amino acid permease/ SLC12A domain-containing protein n=1 Tax=Selaginella moellendorffii TaxID=88036 RepID=D8SSH6_SELML|nr:solute carrier family 12 member 5 [Selaginella moellendorffii]EFJ12492.1 hypothetical protein SELMODRAFT_425250 [Selaginella moellendorffii]|eukprot:XP_002986283.1 solute carrier family 12 member 5 [Selaginella moellendorffii]
MESSQAFPPDSPVIAGKSCFNSHKVASRASSTESLQRTAEFKQEMRENSPPDTKEEEKPGFLTALWRKFRRKDQDGLGTYAGVLIPTCENMWGVLIFLRFFYIVGNAGVWQSFLVAIISFLCALLTTMSLSAVATNGPIEEGGTYYLISRALGPKFGGAVGCLYYIGVMLLAVLEALGAVEMLEFTFSAFRFPSANRIIGLIILFALGLLVYFGIKFVSKLGIAFFLVVLYTMLSYYLGLFTAPNGNVPPSLTGLSWKTFKSNWGPGYEPGVSFSVVLSIFFPCFTGILSGADRAKNLWQPERSIPSGTLGAIVISFIIYTSYLGLWAAVGTRKYLLGQDVGRVHSGEGRLQAMKDVAFPLPILTQLGIIIASLAQALQCLITSPRLLQAIAGDRIIPFLNRLSSTTENGEPRRALIFTTILCMMAAMIGSLDKIAPLVSICFLTCYAALNLSCFILSIMQAPSWRPKWKHYHWFFALLGFFLCSAMNFFIVWYWALAAMVVVGIIYGYIDYRQVEVDWGTGLGGLRWQLAVQSILSVGREARYTVNWRPQLLCLSKPRSSWSADAHAGHELLSFASQLKKGKGLCVVSVVLEGKLEDMMPQITAESVELENCMQAAQVTGFSRVFVAPSYREGKTYAIQSSGLGSLEPNTLLLGWPKNWRNGEEKNSAEVLLETLGECRAVDKAVVLCMHLDVFPSNGSTQEGNIDVWWIVHDGGLLLMLAHLINQHKVWRKCKLRVHTVAERLDNSEEVKNNLRKLLDKVRIVADVEVLELEDADLAPYTFDNTIRMEEALAYATEVAQFRKRAERETKPGKGGNYKALQKFFKRAFPGELSLLRGASPISRRPRWAQRSSKAHSVEGQASPESVHDDEPESSTANQQVATEEKAESFSKEEHDNHNAAAGGDDEQEESKSDLEIVVEGVASEFAQEKARRNIFRAKSAGQLPPIREGKMFRTASEGQLFHGSPLLLGSTPDINVVPMKRTWHTFSQSYSAKKLNEIIVEQSKSAQLVLLNLPDHYEGMEPWRYMEYCEELTQGLQRVVLVRGTGTELWSG